MVSRSSRIRAVIVTIIPLLLMPLTLSGVAAIIGPDQRSSGRAPDLTIVDLKLIAAGNEDLAGRPVYLRNVRVLRLADTHGFFLDAQAGAVYVLPEQAAPAMVAPGEVIDIHGVIATMRQQIPGEVNPPLGWNQRIYVAASTITK